MKTAPPPPARQDSLELFTFAEMRLRPGDRIQLQLPPSLGTERFLVRSIGYLEHASLLVTAPVAANGIRPQIREHDKVVARVFSSQKAFAFDCFVERVCALPYPYLHLSFPERVQGSIIRKSPRIRISIAARMARSPAGAGNAEPVTITNLSADGALVRAPAPLFSKGQEVVLQFGLKLHHVDAELAVQAVIRSILQEDGRDAAPPQFSHGLQFMGVPPNESMILQSLIYQQMIEEPQSVI